MSKEDRKAEKQAKAVCRAERREALDMVPLNMTRADKKTRKEMHEVACGEGNYQSWLAEIYPSAAAQDLASCVYDSCMAEHRQKHRAEKQGVDVADGTQVSPSSVGKRNNSGQQRAPY